LRPFDASGAFRPVDGELGRLALRGAGATILSSALALGVQVIATVILARILTPTDFGLVAMVTTFSLLLANFGLNGFTEAVLQSERMDRFLASNLFWINVGVGALLSVVFAAAGSLLARFYGNPLVAHVAVGVAPMIFLTSLSVLHLALLKRAMHFSVTSINDIVSSTASVAIAICFGWAGWGYWALVLGAISAPLFQSAGAWILCSWVPSLPRRVPGTADMARFAINVYGRFSVNYAARNLDNLLVGWRFNAQALGFYKKAYDLFALSAGQLVAPLANVAVSALSRLKRGSVEYQRYLLSALEVLAFVGMGLGATLTLVGADVIRVLLGPRWNQAGQIFTFFGPGIGVMFLYYAHGWIHLSIGRPDRWFRWSIIECVFTSLLFVVGLPWGPVGVAVAWTTSFWILVIPAFSYAGKPIHLGVGPIVKAAWKYAIASLAAGVLSYLFRQRVLPAMSDTDSIGAIMRIVIVSTVFGILYICAVIALHRGYEPLHQVGRLLRDMVPWTSLPRPSAVLAATSSSERDGIVSGLWSPDQQSDQPGRGDS